MLRRVAEMDRNGSIGGPKLDRAAFTVRPSGFRRKATPINRPIAIGGK